MKSLYTCLESILDDDDTFYDNDKLVVIEITSKLLDRGIISTHLNSSNINDAVSYSVGSGIVSFKNRLCIYLEDMDFSDIINEYKKYSIDIKGFKSNSEIYIENDRDSNPIDIGNIKLISQSITLNGSFIVENLILDCPNIIIGGSYRVSDDPKIYINSVKNVCSKHTSINISLRDFKNSLIELGSIEGFDNLYICLKYTSKFRKKLVKCIDTKRSNITNIDYTIQAKDPNNLIFDSKKFIDLLGIQKINQCMTNISFVGTYLIDMYVEKIGSQILVKSLR